MSKNAQITSPLLVGKAAISHARRVAESLRPTTIAYLNSFTSGFRPDQERISLPLHILSGSK